MDSIMASLAHRLEVARDTKNFQLVKLLEQEKQQVTALISTSDRQLKTTSWLKTFKHRMAMLFGGSTAQVHQFVNGSDCWWYAIDPQTGQYVYGDCEAELRLWLTEKH